MNAVQVVILSTAVFMGLIILSLYVGRRLGDIDRHNKESARIKEKHLYSRRAHLLDSCSGEKSNEPRD